MRCHLMVHYDVLSGFKALELNAQIPAHMEALQEAYSSEDPLDPPTAPVSGTVMQLDITALDNVVQPATLLMLIVPKHTLLKTKNLLDTTVLGLSRIALHRSILSLRFSKL